MASLLVTVGERGERARVGSAAFLTLIKSRDAPQWKKA